MYGTFYVEHNHNTSVLYSSWEVLSEMSKATAYSSIETLVLSAGVIVSVGSRYELTPWRVFLLLSVFLRKLEELRLSYKYLSLK